MGTLGGVPLDSVQKESRSEVCSQKMTAGGEKISSCVVIRNEKKPMKTAQHSDHRHESQRMPGLQPKRKSAGNPREGVGHMGRKSRSNLQGLPQKGCPVDKMYYETGGGRRIGIRLSRAHALKKTQGRPGWRDRRESRGDSFRSL